MRVARHGVRYGRLRDCCHEPSRHGMAVPVAARHVRTHGYFTRALGVHSPRLRTNTSIFHFLSFLVKCLLLPPRYATLKARTRP